MWFSRTFHKKISKCNPDFVSQLKNLTFGYNGMMMRWIEKDNGETYSVYIYDKDKKVAAWACIIPNAIYGANIGFYTNPKYRKKGLALRLAKYISKYHNQLFNGKIIYAPHDIISEAFFRTCIEKNYFNNENSQSGNQVYT